MDARARFDATIAAIHGLGGKGEGRDANIDVRHQEFMAMAEAFLGPDFDREKLSKIELLQLSLRNTQATLYQALIATTIDRARYVEQVNKLHAHIAQQCENVLGSTDFHRLFGATPAEISPHIDRKVFLV